MVLAIRINLHFARLFQVNPYRRKHNELKMSAPYSFHLALSVSVSSIVKNQSEADRCFSNLERSIIGIGIFFRVFASIVTWTVLTVPTRVISCL